MTIESTIPGLFEGARQVVVEPHLQLTEEHVHMRVTSRDGMPTRTTRAIDDKAELEKHVLWEESTESGVQVYLSTPPTRSTDNKGWFDTWVSTDTYRYSWHVRIQVRIQEDEGARLMVFPAPLPEDPLTYCPKNEDHTKPDFSRGDRPFWFHEQVSQSR